MGSGLKNRKKSKADMGDYIPSYHEQKAQVWCINNMIKLWPKPAVKGPVVKEWYIQIQMGKGKISTSPDKYGPTEIWSKIYEYYKFYYDKRSEET